ncbi:hypothetical protein Sru01_20360 [Sphaerisporangium rufum]|uniref:Tat pathway signal sequence domain protein n=2 Tax=Sphaerisporangium rufum TaxID=1381558 RepID=A0A919UYR1_9ACTN|nr:hypothetical protein Sru01_20360 [Sphaerisporangium rufum]
MPQNLPIGLESGGAAMFVFGPAYAVRAGPVDRLLERLLRMPLIPVLRPGLSGSVRAARLLAAALVLAGVAVASPASAASGPALTRIGDTLLDASALYFVSYDGLVNNGSFQRSGIISYAGYQYAAWYTADRTVVVARRALPGGPWQTLRLPHTLSTNDSHNVISLGVSPSDGRIHVGMDVHNTQIYYLKSEAGLATDPGSRSWTAARFGAVQRTLDGVNLGDISYPQFVPTPEGRLQFAYRTGGAGNGTMELAEYDGSTWRRLGRFSSNTGSWSQHGATSTTRSMYVHGLTYGPNGRLHATFTWREGNGAVMCASGGLANHDTGYIYSDDRGRTWRDGAGRQVGTTGGTPVSVSSPGLVVDPLNADHALMNQESQAVDSAGYPHAIISYVPGRFGQCVANYAAGRTANGRAFHLYQDGSGWHKVEIPVPLQAVGRSRIVFGASGDAYVVMPYGRVVAASKATGWTDWRVLFDGSGLNAFGEVLVDYERLTADGVLSVLYQQKSSGNTPSAIRVLDLRLG